MAVEWTPRPLQRVLWVVAAVGIVVIVWRSFDGWAAMGLRTVELLAARCGSWALRWLLASAAIFVAARMHTLLLPDGPSRLCRNLFAYAIWTGVQQFLLQGFFLLRFLRVIPNRAAGGAGGGCVFAVAHLPNPILVPITLIWGFVACLLFLRYRNLYPLMIAHAILGITVAMTVPGPVVHNMRVGLGYLTYRPHMHERAQRMHPLTQP